MTGRKRKLVDRQPSGQPRRHRDGPTPELDMKRRVAVGKFGDPEKSTTPLDILFTTRKITQDEYNVCDEYAKKHLLRYGPGYTTKREARGGELSERRAIQAREFTDMVAEILSRIRGAKTAVDSVVLYQEGPRTRGVDGRRPKKSAFYRGIKAMSEWRTVGKKRFA